MSIDYRANELIISGIHFDLTPSPKNYVQEKIDRLFRHEETIVRIRRELESDAEQTPSLQFTAKGHLEINGPDMNASVPTDEYHNAISLLIDNLDRMLLRRHRLFKVERHLIPAGGLEASQNYEAV